MSYHGDFATGQTVRIGFNSISTASLPATIASPAVTVAKDGADVTPSGGVTLTIDKGAVTGRHEVSINLATDPTTFTGGSNYEVRLSGSSNVGGTSVVGQIVGQFSIANRGGVWAMATRTLSDKTGYSLSATGLDSVAVTAPSGVPTTFTQMMVMVYRRFFKKSTLTATQLKCLADDGTTAITTQAVSDDGTTQTQGTA